MQKEKQKMKQFLFTFAAVLLAAICAGCSDPETPKVKVGKASVALTGKIRCPKCRKTLQKEDVIPEKAPLARCKVCRKISPVMKFYPEVKVPKKKR